MDDKVILAIVAAIGPLVGISLSELLGRWKKREEYKRIVFNEKIKFYSGLVACTAKVFEDVLFSKERKITPDHFANHKKTIASFILSLTLFSSTDVSELSNEFITICEADNISLEKRISKLAGIHSRLRKKCKAELGLDSLEKDISKMS